MKVKSESSILTLPKVESVLVTKETPKPASPAPAPKIKVKGSAVTANMIATLNALKGGKPLTHTQIAAATGREKGNRLRELTAAELVVTSAQEGIRGYVYAITDEGKKVLVDTPKS